MPYRTFAVYNVAGGVLWATDAALLGHSAGGAHQTAERTAGQARLATLGIVVIGVTVAALAHRRRYGDHGRPPPDPHGDLRTRFSRASPDHRRPCDDQQPTSRAPQPHAATHEAFGPVP